MIILVFGEDGYRARQKRDELIAAFRAKFDVSGLNIDLRDGDTLTPEELSAAVRTQPFLASRRMLVVRGLLSRKGEKLAEGFREALSAHDQEHLIVMLVDGLAAEAVAKHPLRKALAKALPAAGMVEYAFPWLAPAALRAWIVEETGRQGRQIMNDAFELLAVSVGPDLWRMHGELAKLAAYRSEGPITAVDVALLVDRHLEEHAFAFTDALGAADARQAAAVLAQELAAGSEAFGLLAMVARQARLLATARSLLDSGAASPETFAASFGLHPFVAKKTLAQARAFSADRIRRLHDAVLTADRNVKRGHLQAEAALQQLVAQSV